MNGLGHRPISHLFQLRTEGEKDNGCWIREKRNKKKCIQNLTIDLHPFSIYPSFLWKNKLKKNSTKTFSYFYSVFSLFTSFDFSLICDVTPAIIHVLHGLSGQIRSRGLCLDSHRTVSILWRLRSRPSSHLLGVQRQLKRGSVTNLTPESLQGIPFKKK